VGERPAAVAPADDQQPILRHDDLQEDLGASAAHRAERVGARALGVERIAARGAGPFAQCGECVADD
jgi:hypothetical protein